MSTTLITERRVLIDNQGVAKLQASIVESEDGGEKKLYAEGTIGYCDTPTANGRIYPTKIMNREIERLQERINESSLYAAVDHPGDGKCLGKGTPVLMADGRILPVEKIATGDRLMGPDGRARTVVSTTTGTGALYRIDPMKGDPWVCNDAHILSLVHTSSGEIIDINVKEWSEKGVYFQSRYKMFSVGVEKFENELDTPTVDPYFVGAWIGDGSKSVRQSSSGSTYLPSVAITTIDPEIKQVCEDIAARWEISVNAVNKTGTDAKTLYLTAERGQGNRLLRTLRDLVGPNNEVPDSIVRGSADTRRQFLAGLIDTDGHLQHNCFYITQKREDYAVAAHRIAKSLGLQAQLSTRKVKGYTDDYYTLTIWGDVDQIPTKLPRKQADARESRKVATRTGFATTAIGGGDYFGFELDGDGRFLLGDYTVNHNSRIRDTGAIIRGLRIESDGKIWGKFQIIEDTDHGRNLAAILRAGGAVGVSSRGLGSTRPHHESGKELVGEDFRLVAFDFVLDPAVSTAYPKFFNEQNEEVPVDNVTTDDLRSRFPELVRAIEESSLGIASQTTAEAMRIEMEQDVEKALLKSREELREQFKVELYPVVVKELKEDFAAKLVRVTASIREDVEAVVRSELAADPEVAGAKLALEQIAKIVVPFKPPVDVQVVIDEKVGEIQKLEQSIKSLEQKVEGANTEKTEANDHARSLGFRLYVEQKLADRLDADSVRELLGDINYITDVDTLQQKVESALGSADKALVEAKKLVSEEENTNLKIEQRKSQLARKRADKLKERDSELREQVARLTERLEEGLASKDRTISNLAERNDALTQRLGQAGRLAEQMEEQAYASTRLTGHPRRGEIMGRVNNGEIRGKQRINQIAANADWNADQMGGQERVRRFFGKGREFQTDNDRRGHEVMTEAGNMGTPVPNMEHADITMEEIIALSGGGHRRK